MKILSRSCLAFLGLAFLNPPGVAHAGPPLDQELRHLAVTPIQKRISQGLDGLSDRELFAAAELLLSAASKRNEEVGFALLGKLSHASVPCIDYYRAEWSLRKGRYAEAIQAVDAFLKTEQISCGTEKPDLFSCCPASKYRNAAGIKRLAQAKKTAGDAEDIQIKSIIPEAAQAKRLPLVLSENRLFLVDTGAEHNIWNSECTSDLELQLDPAGTYGGADSLGKTVVSSYAEPRKPVLGLKGARLGGFAIDLSSSAKEYRALLGEKAGQAKFCGILSPQRIVPTGMMVLDWAGHALLLCQGERCRKALAEIPLNCPLYQFNGRPYFNASINDGPERLFLLDTGATGSSVNANYFPVPPQAKTVQSAVSGVSGQQKESQVLEKAKVSFCGTGFNLKPFPLRGAMTSWEWSENGKIGMDVLYQNLIALDFGKGMALFK